MLPSFLLVLCAMAGALAAEQTPYSVRILDSYVDAELAAKLARAPRNDSEKVYERHTIGNNDYLCELNPPVVSPPVPDEPQPEQEPRAAVLAKAYKIIQQSLPHGLCVWADDLRGMYWTYAFCNADKIIQYHEGAHPKERATKRVATQPNTVFVLGRFSDASANLFAFTNQASKAQHALYARDAEHAVTLVDEKPSPASAYLAQKVVLQIVTDGSMCDMTLQPRTVEVVYRCDPHAGPLPQIIDVHEIKTCHYKLFLHIPGLCEYDPFVPNKNFQDSTVNVLCQKIAEDGSLDQPFQRLFEESIESVKLRDHDLFPVRADNHIDIAGHHLVALNRGFYMGRSKTELKSLSTYFNNRNVVVFTGLHSSLEDLNAQFARTFFNSVGQLVAPFQIDGQITTVQWLHSFIVWFEIYDYSGKFLAISRLEHDASSRQRVLRAQIIDPVSLLDTEGDKPSFPKFDKPDFQAPMNMWNYEYFSEHGEPIPQIKKHPLIHDAPLTGVEAIPVMAYNQGVDDDGRVRIKLVNQKTMQELPGHYNEDDLFVFEIETSMGAKHVIAVKPIDSTQDFAGFTVKLPVPEPVIEKDSLLVTEEKGKRPSRRERRKQKQNQRRDKPGTNQARDEEGRVLRSHNEGNLNQRNTEQDRQAAEQNQQNQRQNDEL